MKTFIDPQFKEYLVAQGIHSFDDLWNQPMQAVEEGNYRKTGAQSEVFRWNQVYVKKQQNYITRLSRWFSPQAICAREFKNLQAWKKQGLSSLEPLYFHQEPGARRAILITRALDEYQSLESWLSACTDAALRSKVFTAVAQFIADLHRKGWFHRCLYPKHVYVLSAHPENIAMIDLEKARKQWRTSHRRMADLSSFFRRCAWIHPKESLQFMKAYWGVTKFETKHRLNLKRLQDRVAEKAIV